MLPGPVFTFEMLTMARRRGHYVLRGLYGALLLALICQTYLPFSHAGDDRFRNGEMSIQEAAGLGRAFFQTFAVTQALIVLLITPALVAGVIADERQRKTLHYLLASRLTGAEIVLGKLFARGAAVGTFVAAGLPVVAILSLVGGIDPKEVWLLFAACASAAFFVAAVSIAVSVHAKRPREAVLLAYLLEAGWLFGPSVVQLALPAAGGAGLRVYEWVQPVNGWLAASSPFVVTAGISPSGTAMEPIVTMIGLQLLYGSVLVAVAVARLRPVHRAHGGPRNARFAARFAGRVRRWRPRPRCGDDALLWKERFAAGSGGLASAVIAAASLMVVGLLVFFATGFVTEVLREIRGRGFYPSVFSKHHRELNLYLRFATSLTFAAWVAGTAVVASGGFTGERETDTWESLLATPLTPAEIVRGKMVGAVWSTRRAGVFWLILVALGLGLGAVHPLGAAAAGLIAGVNVWFASALGTFFSLRARNSARSLAATVATLLFCNVFYLLLSLPFQWDVYFRFVGVAPFVHAISLVGYYDIRDFTAESNPGRSAGEFLDGVMTLAASVLAYGLLAMALTYSLVIDFDDTLDRPRTTGGRRRFRTDATTPDGSDHETALSDADGP